MDNLPSHFCEGCTHVLFESEDNCPECAGARPDDGWTAIQNGTDPWLGRVFDGRYIVTRCVGRGAMGAVYRAISLAISRQFAIKIINFRDGAAGLDAEQVRARLHREIDAIGRLRNPHVVPFYEVIELYDSYVGVVMDYIRGETLEALVDRDGPLPEQRAASLLRQIANGVHEAHEAGMIHRDLKPDNIMVERLPAGDDFAHVLDFGIVQMDDGVAMTRGFLGTPLYASPEQAMGGALDRRSDIYSLGAVLFYMLTGRPPFVSTSVYQILQSHVREVAPGLNSVRETRNYSPALESLVADMLAKNPAKRPQTLAQVIQRLDSLLLNGDLDELVPDSLEFDPVDDTGQFSRKKGAGARTLGEDSSSVFESREKDATGPKAAIFSRGPSRGSIKRLIDEERARRTEFDRVFEGNTGAHSMNVPLPSDAIAAACSPVGDLVVAHSGGSLTVVRAGAQREIVTGEEVTAVGIADSAVLYGTETGEVMVHDAESTALALAEPSEARVTALACGPTGPWVAGFSSGAVMMRRAHEGLTIWSPVQSGPPVTALAVSPQGGMMAVARRPGELDIASLAEPDRSYQRFAVDGTVTALAISDDAHLVAAVLDDRRIVVHLVEGGRRVHTLMDRKNRIFALRFTERDLVGYFRQNDTLYVRQLDREI